ncbi:hypothetical protein BCL64_10562 [Halomonas ventosae]|uniref:LysR substrate binding domain-containing protein n=1 Tax=Halomonas ventosae TaxID=229007 RepID=A0A2T0VNI3_9GAMM|nr:hypothetical protein BCL64_10562 [Halomonas ventosae]
MFTALAGVQGIAAERAGPEHQALGLPLGQAGGEARLAVRLEVEAGLLAPLTLPGFPLRHSWCTVHPRDRFPTPVTELFLRFVREHLAELHTHFSAPPSPLPSHGVDCLPVTAY